RLACSRVWFVPRGGRTGSKVLSALLEVLSNFGNRVLCGSHAGSDHTSFSTDSSSRRTTRTSRFHSGGDCAGFGRNPLPVQRSIDSHKGPFRAHTLVHFDDIGRKAEQRGKPGHPAKGIDR